MIVKLLLGQYSYLYHDEENIDKLKDQINELTEMKYIIKWKDFEDDMITIERQIDLQNCLKACKSKKKDTFKLYIIEIFENEEKIEVNKEETSNLIQQKNMKQENQEQQQKVQFEIQEVCASEIIFESKDKKELEKKQIEIPKAKSPQKLIKIEPTKEEKDQFFKECISLAFEEFYPGFNQNLEQNQNIKVQQ